MTEIHLSFNNTFDFESLLGIFPVSDEFEFTAKNVFRRKTRVECCGEFMVHNGFNYVRKKGFGKVKVGKQLCKCCGSQFVEDKSFWKKLLNDWFDAVCSLVLRLRDSSVGWNVIEDVFDFLIPYSKDSLRNLFNRKIDVFEYPQRNFLIVNYDEQHPKRGRAQKFRLTLLDYETKVPIADELFDNKDSSTIEDFLRNHLDVSKPIVLITDCDRSYPQIFKKIWGNKVIHQKCLLHLNKTIVKEFGKNTDLLEEHTKYSMLNIFYNRTKELKFLNRLIKKQDRKIFDTNKEKQDWIKNAKTKFYDYIRTLEKKRRREGKNLTQRTKKQAKEKLDELKYQNMLLPKHARSRLVMIERNWKYFTAFYDVKNCPATNNAIENFYSTSLKTHRKKQHRTDQGLKNHMKLSALKRAELFKKPKKTFIEIYSLIKSIIT